MKKLLVLALAFVLAIGVASVASAAEITTSIGGDFYYYYQTRDKVNGVKVGKVVGAPDNAVSYGNITAKVTEGNTWAKLWFEFDSFRGAQTLNTVDNTVGNDIPAAMFYAVGMDKIADIFSWSFSSKDVNFANMGQAPLTEVFNCYRSDPFFNSYGLEGVLSGKVETDSFYVGADVKVVNETEINKYAIAASAKFDGGDVHVGYQNQKWLDDKGLYLIGGTYNVNDLKLAVDFIGNAQHANRGEFKNIYSGNCNALQANVGFQNINGTLLYVMNDDNASPSKDFFGLGASYTMDKWTFGAKYFNTDDAAFEVYGQYDVGAFDVKLGLVDEGVGDSYGVLGVHASI